MTDTATPLYANAFRTLKRRAEAGHELTLAEIEGVFDDDPVTRQTIAEIADEIRAGKDVTVSEIARRTRMPEEFVVALVSAFVGGFAIGLKQQAPLQ